MNGQTPPRKSKSDRPLRNDSSVAEAAQRARLDGMFKDGLIHFQSGDVTQAIRVWELILDEVPDHPQATRYLEDARSQKQLQEMAAFDGSSNPLLDQIFAGEQAAAAAEEEPSEPEPSREAPRPVATEELSADDLFRKGEGLYHKGNYREARQIFEKVLASSSSHPDAYFLLELSKAREADQKDLNDAETTAQSLYDQGDFDGAASEWGRVVDAQPKNQHARDMLEASKSANRPIASPGPGLGAGRREGGMTQKMAAPVRTPGQTIGGGTIKPSAGKPSSTPQSPTGKFTAGPVAPTGKSSGVTSPLAIKTPAVPPAARPAGSLPPTIRATSAAAPPVAPVAAPAAEPEAALFDPESMKAPLPEGQPAAPEPSASDTARLRAPASESTARLRSVSIAAAAARMSGRPAPQDEALDGAQIFGDSAAEAAPLDETTSRRMLREYFEIASKAENNGELDRALELYKKILNMSPQSEIAQERASALEMMLQSRKFKQAFDALHRAKSLSAREPALALHEVKKALQLRPELEEAQKLLPQLQKAVTQKRWFRNRPMMAPLLAGVGVIVAVLLWLIFGVFLPQVQEHRVTGLLNSASKFIGQGQFAEAEEKILEARSLSPRSQEVRRVHGRLLLAKGEAAEAAEQFRGLNNSGQGGLQDRYLLATALSKAGKNSEAGALLKEIISEDSTFYAARREYAWLMLKQNNLAEASEQSNALISSQPEEPGNAVLAAALFEKMGMDKEALDQFERAYTLGARESEQLMRHIELLIKLNRLEDAQKVLNDSRSAFATDMEFRMRQASIARRRGKLGEAEEAFRNALILDPKNEEAALELASVLISQKDLSAAEKVLAGFLERSGNKSVAAFVQLGDVQLSRENYTQAADSYRKAQALDPTLPDIAKKIERALRAGRGR